MTKPIEGPPPIMFTMERNYDYSLVGKPLKYLGCVNGIIYVKREPNGIIQELYLHRDSDKFDLYTDPEKVISELKKAKEE